jgi:hypothetical protein
MVNYTETVKGRRFTDLTGDADFQRDLVRFFSGARYGMDVEEIKSLGPKALTEKFVEHMRWQSTNELIALKDYNYVKNKEVVSEDELTSFGSLMVAFDNSEGGGTGVLDGAVDYLSAFATSPSTVATVFTGGWGVGSKLAAKATGRAAQIGIRQAVSDLVAKGASKKAIQDQIVGSTASAAVKGAAASALVEGTVGAGMSLAQGKIRQEAAGIEYGVDQLLRDAALSATLGGALGGASRAYDAKQQRQVVDSLIGRTEAINVRQVAAAENTAKTVAAAPADVVNRAADRAVTIANIVSAREKGIRLDPLDKDLVEQGNLLKREVLSDSVDRAVTSGLSLSTIKSITAATVEIATKLNVGPNERITSAIASAVGRGEILTPFLKEVKDKYNLSQEQLSYIYLADVSEAGKTLAEASIASKATKGQTADAAKKVATETFENVSSDIAVLARSGISTLSDREAAEIVGSVYNTQDGVLASAYKFTQDMDAVRIAYMTSQVGTTMANLATSTGNLLIDMSDQFWKNTINLTTGQQVGDKVQRRWMGGMTSTIKGMSWGKDEAKLLKEIFFEERPEQFSQLFYEATRAEVAVESSSLLAKSARLVNTLNSAVDSSFKEATLYSSVDRSLRELNDPAIGGNLKEFLSKNASLDSLPEGFLEKAVDDARRFTFQRSYSQDKSAFGKAAQSVIDMHQKLPFVVSAGVGVPFPRYIANHLEHINDYTPLGIITGGLNKLDTTLYKDVKLVGDAFKTGEDRIARQLTGASLILLGAYTAAQKEGEIDYKGMETETGVLDIARTFGPWLMNFYLGDLYYRWKNDLPLGDVPKTIQEIATGVTDLGINTDALAALSESIKEGKITESLARVLGDVAATYTYPLTFSRDFVGQIYPEFPSTPYTRDVFGGSLDEVVSETNYLDDMMMRATRFLPEVDFVQYSQSFDGKSSIPYYSIFSDGPIGTWNPISKQLGFSESRKPNAIQRELNRLGIEEFEIYGNTKVPNSTIDVAVREALSKTMPEKFFAWKSQVKHGGAFANRTYDEIESMDERKILLTSFINTEVTKAKDQAEAAFTNFISEQPKAAAGYVRNMYLLQEQELARGTGNKEIYDTAVKTFTSGDFGSAADFLGASESVAEEVSRRMLIMDWAKQFQSKKDIVPFPEIQNR